MAARGWVNVWPPLTGVVSAEPAAQIAVPAAVVPVATEVGGVLGYHHEVKRPWGDGSFTARTDVGLAGGIRLDRGDDGVVEEHVSTPEGPGDPGQRGHHRQPHHRQIEP